MTKTKLKKLEAQAKIDHEAAWRKFYADADRRFRSYLAKLTPEAREQWEDFSSKPPNERQALLDAHPMPPGEPESERVWEAWINEFDRVTSEAENSLAVWPNHVPMPPAIPEGNIEEMLELAQSHTHPAPTMSMLYFVAFAEAARATQPSKPDLSRLTPQERKMLEEASHRFKIGPDGQPDLSGLTLEELRQLEAMKQRLEQT